MGHREQVVAGGDARTAHRDETRWFATGEECAEFPLQPVGRLEPPVLAQVVGERPVHRPRNVARDPVERFDFATEARRRARVDEQAAGIQVGLHCVGIQQPFQRRRTRGFLQDPWPRSLRRNRGWFAGFHGQAERYPARPSAIEHRHAAVPVRPQQRPQARGHGSVVGVVGDDLGVGADAPRGNRLRERVRVGPRMPAIAGVVGLPAQVAIEVCVTRAGNVRGTELALAERRVGQAEAAVDDDEAGGAEHVGKRFGLHERAPVQARLASRAGSTVSIRCSRSSSSMCSQRAISALLRRQP